MEETNIIAIEIGSSKIKGAHGLFNPSSGILTVKAVEEEPLQDWVRYGAVVNVEETSHLVNRIIRKIENRIAPRKVSKVYLALGGRSCCSSPRVIDRKFPEEQEITDTVLHQLRDEVAETPLPDRDLFAVVPRQYTVDNCTTAKPKGTIGKRISFAANLITCQPQSKRNIDILFNDKLGLEIGGYEVRQLALGDLVLINEEKRLGCMLVDFGAETTAVSIYKNGHLQYMATIPIGSRNITRDLTTLNYLEEKAEEIKIKYGNAGTPVQNTQQLNGVDITSVNNYVCHRAAEIIANIRKQIELAGFKNFDLSAGIIIVGQGAKLIGFNDRLASATHMKLRIGAITIPEIRIVDSKISATDAADVISVLYKAAVHGAGECLTSDIVELTEDEEEVAEDQPEEEHEPVGVEIDPETEPDNRGKKKRKGFWKGFKERINTLIDDSYEEEDGEYVSLDDDKD